jgi:hypothetical protein
MRITNGYLTVDDEVYWRLLRAARHENEIQNEVKMPKGLQI